MAEQNVFLSQLKERDLWKVLEEKSKNYSNKDEYMSGMKKVCEFAADRSVTIRDTFPMYTRHDEQHILNVIKLMENLLGDKLEELNRDEAAMLILAACCHDIGMSCGQEKEELLKNEQMKNYLDTHASEYLKAYARGGDEPVITDDIFRNFLRSIHHKRIGGLLYPIWPSALDDLYNNLIWVCKSHGKSCSEIDATIPESESEADLRLCAVLLRLADILDFDTTRAPQAIYDYCGLEQEESPEAKKSKEEWDKHIASKGFHFESLKKRDLPYELPYRAVCHSMQTEQAVNRYLDWVDRELTDCCTTLRKDETDWKNLVLPDKVKRSIRSKGYLSGQYLFTTDQSQVLNLLGGEELYSDPAAFVRELLQNAIDAVRTRKAFDQSLPKDWTGQINIRTWTDKDGDWFRIEDNGTGMTKEIIENHLLKVGSSYYNSDEFKKEKRNRQAEDYTPISRFGIGILSCFMGDTEHSRVEISTKWYRKENSPSLRLRMDGLNGYYAMYSSEKDDNHPGDMPGTNKYENEEYRNEPGTVVAVRTNLYRTGKYLGFKEIVDKWLVFPPVPVYYDGPEGYYDYPTQEKFMNYVRDFYNLTKNGVLKIPVPESELKKIWPEITLKQQIEVVLQCADLGQYSRTPNLTGAVFKLTTKPTTPYFFFYINEQLIYGNVHVALKLNYSTSTLELDLSVYSDNHEWRRSQKPLKLYFPLQEQVILCYKYFRTIQKNTDLKNIAVYNGICCGEAAFFFCHNYIEDGHAILILRDDFRPEMNLARNNIEHLPMKLLFMCELIRKQLIDEGFSINYKNTLSKACRFSPSEAFLSVLKDRPDWLEQLIVNTEKCKFPLTQLKKTLHNQKELALDFRFYELYYGFHYKNLYEHFLLAYLQSHCTLHLDNSKIILQEGEQNHLDDGWKLFPPGFFLTAANENSFYFTKFFAHYRGGCNACHPLSKFLLSKAKEIKIKSPGCFNRIVSAIADENGDKLIPVLNDQLQILKSIPGNPLGVTDDLLLKESDLIILETIPKWQKKEGPKAPF